MPTEWTPHATTWMVFPHNRILWESEWGVSLADVQQDFAAAANTIVRFESVKLVADPAALDRVGELCMDNVELIELAIDDSWCRDSGPSFVCCPQLELVGVSRRFNVWGGKSTYAQDASLARRTLDGLGLECFGVPLVNEGGTIHVDGEGTLITTESVLLNANRNPGPSKAETEALFVRLLGMTRTIWLLSNPDRVTGDMTGGHVDGACAFARPGALLLDATSGTTSAYAGVVRENRRVLGLALGARGWHFELIELFDAGEVAPEEGVFHVSYTSSYIVNDAITISAYGVAVGDTAAVTLAWTFPAREVASVCVDHLTYGGGGVYYTTQQQPAWPARR